MRCDYNFTCVYDKYTDSGMQTIYNVIIFVLLKNKHPRYHRSHVFMANSVASFI